VGVPKDNSKLYTLSSGALSLILVAVAIVLVVVAAMDNLPLKIVVTGYVLLP
jgi:hypothetical protein